MNEDINWGKIAFWIFVAFVVWALYDGATTPSEPHPYNPDEVCSYYDADPTQWVDMVEECYVP